MEPRFRQLKGFWGILVKVLLALIPVVAVLYVINIPFYLGLSLYRQQYVALFATLVLVLCFLTAKPTRNSSRDKVPVYDIVLALVSLVVGGYVAIFLPKLLIYMGTISLTNVILGIISILLVLEATRRLTGWPIVILGIIFIIYPFVSHLAPGILNTRQLHWQRVITFLYLSPDGLMGSPAVIVSTIVLIFILFGRFLLITGGGQFLTDFAMAAVGRYRGGTAKVSVLASALFGMISGSPSANVATVGVITIPIMKKAGYSSTFAAAVEATASTGGAITPPVMSAVAFLIAEFLQMPYAQVAIAAVVPAFLYYVALYVQIDLEAPKTGVRGLPRHELPSLRKSIGEGWLFVIPVIVLLVCLFTFSQPPELSGLYATVSVFIVGWLRKATRIGLGRLTSILEDTGRSMLELGIIGMAAGFIIGAITITGLGVSFSTSLVNLSGGSVFVLLLLAAIACIILGMGMPILAVYIIVVILIGPALIQLGIQPLAAHLFILYFGAMSFITPPVCLAAFVAAGIAQSPPMRTGFVATRLSVAAYLVPFVFAFAPALLLMGPAKDTALVFIPTTLGIVMAAIALAGYLFGRLNPGERVWCAAAGLGLLIPNYLIVNGIGLALGVLFFLWHRRKVGASRLVSTPLLAKTSEAEASKFKKEV